MGARLLRRWLLRPLVRRSDLGAAGRGGELLEDAALRRAVRAELKDVRDLERLAAKIGRGGRCRGSCARWRCRWSGCPPSRRAGGARAPLLLETGAGLDTLDDVRELLAAR
jgi:hypothetical protein